MRELGIGCTFLTNNPSKSSHDYISHLRKMGLAATPDERVVATVTSTVDLARLRMLAEAAAAQAGLPADQDARAVWRATVRRGRR